MMKMKINRKVFFSAAAVLLNLPAMGQNKAGNVLDLKYSIEDSAIVYPESFETDAQKLRERWYLKNYTTANPQATTSYDPGATEAEIKRRLAALPTAIELPYNKVVLSYIERYTKTGRKQLTQLLGLSSYYLPIFEQALEEAGLPLELKYLPMIESSLDPCATSKHGAAGLWQFMLATARGYDMEVSSLVDERRDPYVSTQMACKLLKDLHETYGDWSLAIAAYNCGPGTVNTALARAGGDPASHDFWSIYYYLPAETRGYVPMFIAANYVMNYYPQHGIQPVLITKPLVTDTLHLSDRVHFNQISAVLDIPVEEIRILNPQFRADIIPASVDRPYNLILPSQQIHAYIVSEDQILAYQRDKYAQRMDVSLGGVQDDAAAEVGASDQLLASTPFNPSDPVPVEDAAIAEVVYEQVHPDYVNQEAVTPRRRRTETPAAAQAPAAAPASTAASTTSKPKAETTASTATTQKKVAATPAKNNNTTAKNNNNNKNNSNNKKQATTSKPKTHTVAAGENLTVIAKKNGVTVSELKTANPKINPDMLHPGDKITIPAAKKSKK